MMVTNLGQKVDGASPANSYTAYSAKQIREMFRHNHWNGHTSAIANPYVQGNVVILSKHDAEDFLCYCQRNPKPCPLLAVSQPGEQSLPSLGEDINITTDLPRYRIWRHGELTEELHSIGSIWQKDFVTFVIGCSFSFELALINAGLVLRHQELGRNVSMFRSSIKTQAAGNFSGDLVVSMRSFSAQGAIRAIQISSLYPQSHGAPVHIGDPTQIGINDLHEPDFGDVIPLLAHEIPLFWACGVTPQLAIQNAKPVICITHAPGAMLVTDLFSQHQIWI